MKSKFPGLVRVRRTSSKMSSLLLLLQRSPLVQMIFPEARILGGAGVGELTKWTVATFAGLGAFDSVAGATVLQQISPTFGSLSVTGAAGSPLLFIVQVTGSPSTPKSWQITGTIPAGMTHSNSVGQTTNSISGTPTQTGSFPITITAWEKPGNTGGSISKTFNITIGDPIISSHPASVSINSGSTTTLSVTATGSGLGFQWFSGDPPPGTASPIALATSSTFTTPPLTQPAKFWVRVTRAGLVANSNAATVSINPTAVQPTITQQPSSSSINAGETATLTVVTSGDPANYEWYEGSPPDTSTLVFSGGPSFTTPPLTSSKTYWVKAINPGGNAPSNAAVVTVIPLRETWRNAIFSAPQLANPLVSGSTANPDLDELTNDGDYIFGTSPLAFDGTLLSNTRTGSNEVTLQFVAKQAAGSGYFGMTRHYALESRLDLVSGQWDPLPGFEDIIGNGQTVTVPVTPADSKRFYHLKAWLTP